MYTRDCAGCGQHCSPEAKFCRQCGLPTKTVQQGAAEGFQWRWALGGALIMFGTTFAVSFMLALFGTDTEKSPGVLILANVIGFTLGGFLIGKMSRGKTILEAGTAAACAVAIGLILVGDTRVENLTFGTILPFGLGLLGGWLGEKAQGTI